MDNNISATSWFCSCRTELTQEHLIGNVLRCPNCGSIMFVQGDLAPQATPRMLYESKFNNEQAIELGIQTAIEKYSVKKRKHIKDICCTLKYYPILDIQENSGQKRRRHYPIFENEPQLNVDCITLKLDHGATNATTEFEITDYVTAKLNERELNQIFDSIGNSCTITIKYAPIYTWSAKIKKKQVELFLDASADLPVSMQQNIADAKPGEIDVKRLLKITSDLLFWGVSLFSLIAMILKHGFDFNTYVFLICWALAVLVGWFFKAKVNPIATIVITLIIFYKCL